MPRYFGSLPHRLRVPGAPVGIEDVFVLFFFTLFVGLCVSGCGGRRDEARYLGEELDRIVVRRTSPSSSLHYSRRDARGISPPSFSVIIV